MPTPPHRALPEDPPEVHARLRDGLDLVKILAAGLSRQLHRAVPPEELESFAREGLLSAARSFDPSRRVPFRCWATLRMRGAMIDGLRSMGGLPRRVYQELRAASAGDAVRDALQEEDATAAPRTQEAADEKLGTSLSTIATAMAMGFLARVDPDTEADEDRLTPEDRLARAELMSGVRTAIAKLPDSERALVERHYFGEVTLDEAARSLGLSKSWGSRLHARAVEAIGRDLKRSKIAR